MTRCCCCFLPWGFLTRETMTHTCTRRRHRNVYFSLYAASTGSALSSSDESRIPPTTSPQTLTHIGTWPGMREPVSRCVAWFLFFLAGLCSMAAVCLSVVSRLRPPLLPSSSSPREDFFERTRPAVAAVIPITRGSVDQTCGLSGVSNALVIRRRCCA